MQPRLQYYYYTIMHQKYHGGSNRKKPCRNPSSIDAEACLVARGTSSGPAKANELGSIKPRAGVSASLDNCLSGICDVYWNLERIHFRLFDLLCGAVHSDGVAARQKILVSHHMISSIAIKPLRQRSLGIDMRTNKVTACVMSPRFRCRVALQATVDSIRRGRRLHLASKLLLQRSYNRKPAVPLSGHRKL